MKKKPSVDEDPLDREIDFSKARPNPYFLSYHSPRTVRVLEPELAELFPDNDSVNSALRSVADAASRMRPQKVSARRVTVPKKAKKAHS
ncbi:MAG TPA: hypothetical protein VFP80_01785 [Thermoanaerobaculia bacterium]|nr:hypothetical protein [Thermoanaerobaculia bacterium]